VAHPERVTEEPVDVLIVDDQRPFRSVARTVVNLVGGWRVAAEAETGEDAVAAAERVRPGVVLMDINLPGISGVNALKILAEDPLTSHIPVIALSANAMPRDITKGLEAGFFSYLTKPIKVNEFMETLDVALMFAKTRSIAAGIEKGT